MSQHLPTLFQEYIHLSKYSRWLHDENRRETWEETVERYFDFFEDHLKENVKFVLDKELRNKLQNEVLNLKVMPSMRCLMTAGEALKRENIAGYNCCYIAIDNQKSFDEILYILMNGTGVGFSVEQKYTGQLPIISEDFHPTDTTIIVADSKLGWAKGFRELLSLLYSGYIPKYDLSKLRPAGATLKVFGGRSAGPGPLDDLFKFAISLFKKASGRRLTSLECHDLVCKVGDIVVSGGVRRSALISLSDLFDDRMRLAKSGEWWNETPQRALSNNSFVINDTIDVGMFMKEWLALYESKSGERGIFSRAAAKKQAKKYGRRKDDYDFGCNPCAEILLRSRQFCNLSEVVIRADDTIENIKKKLELATIIGCFQSTLTNFKYISKKFKENCEEERLLGVSLTGIMDNKYTNGKEGNLVQTLTELRNYVVDTTRMWSKKLNINMPTSITCVKPSGTVSSLVNSASGIHDRFSPFYIRTVRQDKKDPLSQLMIDIGIPHEDDVMKPDFTHVFSFPIASPKDSIFKGDRTAIEQLEFWLTYQRHWCEHKPSITVSVKEDEWIEVGAWVWEHLDEMSGVSFLPFSDFIYSQAPFQSITKEQYVDAMNNMPHDVDWSKLKEYEKKDTTTSSQELACVGGACSID